MRFVHITDTHVGPTAQYKVLGHRSMAILEALVEQSLAQLVPPHRRDEVCGELRQEDEPEDSTRCVQVGEPSKSVARQLFAH